MKRASKSIYKQEVDYLRVTTGKNLFYDQMNKHCYIRILILFLLFFYNSDYYPQGGSQPDSTILIGAFIHSSEDMGFTQYNNYQQMIDLGLNSVYQIAAKNAPGPGSNLDTLANYFPHIVAANDSGAAGVRGASVPENIDWISYFTHAKYTKWEAEGSSVFNETDNENVKVKYDFGNSYSEGNVSGRRSDTSSANINKFLIKGPDYWQYPRYTFTNPGWNPLAVTYKAVFRMKIGDSSEIAVDVCEIFVTQSYFDTSSQAWVETDTLFIPGNSKVLTLTTDNLSTEYQNFEIPYTYYPYYDQTPENTSNPSPPTLFAGGDEEEQITGYGLNIGSKVQFKVRWLGNRELFVDYIEVYDQRIWEDWFIENPEWVIDSIAAYDQAFASGSSAFYEKLKYYGTIDEPHSIDCYEPLRKVQFLLDSLNIDADLLVHFFPGWNGYRDGDKTWPQFNQLAQPKKLMFWYFPYLVEDDGTYLSDAFGLEQFRNNLQMAHTEQPGFFVETQAWGRINIQGNYEHYRSPTPSEVTAQAMLALAHGVKGIYFEPYYSTYDTSTGDTTTGIVYTMDGNNQFPPREIYYTIQGLNNRLKNSLGKLLYGLDYTGDYLQLRYFTPSQNPTPQPLTKDYLTIGLYSTAEDMN